MASAARSTRRGKSVPTPAGFLGLLVLGAVAVLVLPEVADDLPHPGRAEQARYAATSVGVMAVTALYLYLVAGTPSSLSPAWLPWTLAYVAGLVIVKFILSPTAFNSSEGTGLGEFLTAGVLVMPLYIGALILMYRLSDRRRRPWSFSSKLAVAAGLAIVAVLSRLLVAGLLGTASQYLDDFVGPGLVLPLVVVAASLAVMESFDRAGPNRKDALHAGTAIVVAHHLLWVLFMSRLFA